MLLQIPHDPERLPARGAAERLLPAVKPQVRLQVVPQPEALAALRAGVRPLARVEPQVAAEALPQGERLGALGARVRLLAGVEALVPPEDLPPLEGFPAEAADVAIAGVRDDILEAPDVVAPCEAAEAVARVGALMPTQVSGESPAGFVVGVEGFHGIVALELGNCEQVDQLHSARQQQLLIWRGELQLHLQMVLGVFRRVDALPHADLRRSHGSVGGGRTVGGPLGRADAGLLRFRLDRFLRTFSFRDRRVRLQD